MSAERWRSLGELLKADAAEAALEVRGREERLADVGRAGPKSTAEPTSPLSQDHTDLGGGSEVHGHAHETTQSRPREKPPRADGYEREAATTPRRVLKTS